MSRTSLSDGKRAGQKVQRKIAIAVQNVKPLYFLSHSFEFRQTDQREETEGLEMEGLERER